MRALGRADPRNRFCSLNPRSFDGFAARNLCFRGGLVRQRRGANVRHTIQEVLTMLGWVVTFLVIALIAGILGFGGIAGASVEIAKIIFFIAVVLFLISAVLGVVRGRSRV
jgi:uncharacterized membrane protein YtjA (UPF0391 family)